MFNNFSHCNCVQGAMLLGLPLGLRTLASVAHKISYTK